MDEQTQLQVFRELGNLDARVGNIEKDIGEVKADIRDVKADVKALLAREAQPQAAGGRPLLTIGSTAAGGIGVGGLLVAAAQYVLGGGVQQQQPPAQPTAPPIVQAQPEKPVEGVNLPRYPTQP